MQVYDYADRRKDLLLQQHGYLVMRILTTDVAKELSAVLDSIIATLAHCERKYRFGSDLKILS